MRGKAEHFSPEIMRHRITPAYAGKRVESTVIAALAEDHPRLCGEKHRAAGFPWLLPGSPPPMRGKVLCAVVVLCVVGITPAYAGKRQWVYLIIYGSEGSPPPMRGKVVRHTHTQDRFRITPAYAGKRIRRRATKDDW